MEITKAMYEFALQRIEELLPVTPDCPSEEDPRAAELDMVSGIVEEYENIHYPTAQPTVGEVIADAMDEMKMSGKELAQRIGVSPNCINDYISGRAEPTLKIARLLCQILKIHSAEFQALT